MGAVVYLALVSGMVLFGVTPSAASQPNVASAPSGRIEVYWIISFLAGFSDKFYIGIINLLVEKTILPGRHESESINVNTVDIRERSIKASVLQNSHSMNGSSKNEAIQ